MHVGVEGSERKVAGDGPKAAGMRVSGLGSEIHRICGCLHDGGIWPPCRQELSADRQ